MSYEQWMVKEFHKKFGFTINKDPTLVDIKLGLVRHKHTMDEMKELKKAILENNLVGIADALGDLLYFIYGTGVAYGIYLPDVFREIHLSNMTKTRPDPDQYIDAKAVKGIDYTPPNIERILRDSSLKETEK